MAFFTLNILLTVFMTILIGVSFSLNTISLYSYPHRSDQQSFIDNTIERVFAGVCSGIVSIYLIIELVRTRGLSDIVIFLGSMLLIVSLIIELYVSYSPPTDQTFMGLTYPSIGIFTVIRLFLLIRLRCGGNTFTAAVINAAKPISEATRDVGKQLENIGKPPGQIFGEIWNMSEIREMLGKFDDEDKATLRAKLEKAVGKTPRGGRR